MASVLDAASRQVAQRFRPYYESKALAEADKARIREQNEATGSGDFLFNREAAADYDAAKRIVGDVPLAAVAKFWRLHHPDKPKEKLAELAPKFLKDVEERLGQGRHYSDLKSRIGQFINPELGGLGARYPETVNRQEILDYVRNVPDASPRTKRNDKTAVCVFFNRMLEDRAHHAASWFSRDGVASGASRQPWMAITPEPLRLGQLKLTSSPPVSIARITLQDSSFSRPAMFRRISGATTRNQISSGHLIIRRRLGTRS